MEQKQNRAWEDCFSNMLYWKWEGEPPAWSWSSAVNFWEKALPLSREVKILELGCALGWHSIELARRGYDVTGLEWSQPFLDEAKRRAHLAGVRPTFIHGDMTCMTFENEFDVILLWSNTFGMFSDEDNRQTLRNIARALKPGGRTLIDIQNYSGLPEKTSQGWHFDKEDKNLLFLVDGTKSVPEGRFGFDVISIDLTTGKQHRMPNSWRLYLLPELKHILKDSGLNLLTIYGDDPKIADWKNWKKGEAFPYLPEAYTDQAALRIFLCEKKKD